MLTLVLMKPSGSLSNAYFGFDETIRMAAVSRLLNKKKKMLLKYHFLSVLFSYLMCFDVLMCYWRVKVKCTYQSVLSLETQTPLTLIL